MYKVVIGDRNYGSYDFINQTTMKAETLPVDPIQKKLFHNDIIEYDGEVFHVRLSSLRKSKHISGVAVMTDNVTYGKDKNKRYLRVLPDDSRLPSFLVPMAIKKMEFNKKPVNEYVIFRFENWEGKHPVGSILNRIGSVDTLSNFYEYQLYCKSLNSSISSFMKRAVDSYKTKTDDEYTDSILDHYGSCIEDRRSYNVFSIDPPGSTDYDDAISIQQNGDITELSVYISNVTIWIEALGLWNSFSERVATIYLPDRKRPMLPTILSDCLCSLQEGQNRFAIVLDLQIDNGKIVQAEYHNCLISVNKNHRYETPELLREKDYDKIKSILCEISPQYNYMGKIRNSHDVVAYAMILFNWWTGDVMRKYENGIHRSFVLNPNVEVPENLPDDVQLFVKIWNSSAGQYLPYGSDMQHQTLNVDAYVHMSSPIRRLVDLLNMIQHQKNLGMISLSQECLDFYDHWYERLDYINTTMRAIRKVQSDCALLARCTSEPELLLETYTGYVYDKIDRNDNMYQYIVYLPHFKLNTRVALREDIPNYTALNFKLFMFMEQANFKHKIRLQYISHVA